MSPTLSVAAGQAKPQCLRGLKFDTWCVCVCLSLLSCVLVLANCPILGHFVGFSSEACFVSCALPLVFALCGQLWCGVGPCFERVAIILVQVRHVGIQGRPWRGLGQATACLPEGRCGRHKCVWHCAGESWLGRHMLVVPMSCMLCLRQIQVLQAPSMGRRISFGDPGLQGHGAGCCIDAIVIVRLLGAAESEGTKTARPLRLGGRAETTLFLML